MLKGNTRKKLKSAAVRLVGGPLAQRAVSYLHRDRTVFLMYHGVSRDDESLSSATLLRESQFREQMDFVRENFECLPIDAALESNGRPRKRPGLVVTFDDGYGNNFEIALPILAELGIPATIYVTTRHIIERDLFWPDKIWMAAGNSAVSQIDLTGVAKTLRRYTFRDNGERWLGDVQLLMEDIKRTDPEERERVVDDIVIRFGESPGATPFDIEVEGNVFTPLTVEQLAELSEHPLITIGAHSHCHNLLNQIPLSQAEQSIRKSKEILEHLTGKRIDHFSYPNGNLTPEVARVVREAGFKSAVSVPPGFFRPGDDPFFIKRYMPSAHMSLDLFKTKLTGVFELAKRFGL